jgi:hypothetical protein
VANCNQSKWRFYRLTPRQQYKNKKFQNFELLLRKTTECVSSIYFTAQLIQRLVWK